MLRNLSIVLYLEAESKNYNDDDDDDLDGPFHHVICGKLEYETLLAILSDCIR